MTARVTISGVLAIFATAAVPAIGLQQERVPDIRQLQKLVGQTQRICGRVATYDYPGKDGSGDCTLRLDIGGPYWKPVFYVLLRPDPGSAPVADLYLAQQVCANGKVESDSKHTPFIAIDVGSGLQVIDHSPAPLLVAGAVQACETGVVAPRLTKEIKPRYPEDEFHERAQSGDRSPELVLLQAAVDQSGGVSACRTVYGRSPSFSHAAETAVKQWRFTPGTRGGVPVVVIVQIEMKFTL